VARTGRPFVDRLRIMDAYQAVVSKRDTRKYLDDPIASGVLERILNAARMAGSGKNRQSGRMVVITDTEQQRALGASGDFCDWIHEAPVVVAFAIAEEGGVRPHFDIGRMAQNAMIVATAEGLASCPVTINRPEQARAALGMPDGWDVPMAVTIGHGPPVDPNRRSYPRIPLSEVVHWGTWTE
jgi:nitroreductase